MDPHKLKSTWKILCKNPFTLVLFQPVLFRYESRRLLSTGGVQPSKAIHLAGAFPGVLAVETFKEH